MSRAFTLPLTAIPLTSPSQLLAELPLSESDALFVEESRQAVRDILEGNSHRLLLVVGPCSIHDTTAAVTYATQLQSLREEVADRFLIVMRVHGEKPRTTIGWKGLLYDPELNGHHDIRKGLQLMRKLLLTLTRMKIPVATEFLDPYAGYYLGDLVSWGQIGARTSASQIHRQMASGLPMPVGFKNTTQGDITPAVNAILAAATPQTYFGLTPDGRVAEVSSNGNPDAHLVLRGSENGGNFQPEAVARAVQLLRQAELPTRLLIDCSHDNCRSDHTRQPSVLSHVMDQTIAGNSAIAGAILESYLQGGRQLHTEDLHNLLPDISITDPCLDWSTTERIILDAYTRFESALTRASIAHRCE